MVERFIIGPVRRLTKSPVRMLILSIGISQVLLAVTYIPGLAPTSQAPFPQPFSSNIEVGGVVLGGMSMLTLIGVPLLLVLSPSSWSSPRSESRSACRGEPRRGPAVWDLGLSCQPDHLGNRWRPFGTCCGSSTARRTTSFNAEAIGPFLLMLTMGAAALGAFVSFPIAVGRGSRVGAHLSTGAGPDKTPERPSSVFGVILLAVLLRGKAIGRAFAAEGAAVPERPGLRIPDALRDSPCFETPRRGRSACPWWLPSCSRSCPISVEQIPARSRSHLRHGRGIPHDAGWLGRSGQPGAVCSGRYRCLFDGALGGTIRVELGRNFDRDRPHRAVVMVVIGLPALRVRGLALAVTTLGLAVIAPDWLYQQGWLGGSTPFNVLVPTMTVLPGLGDIGSQLYSTTWYWSSSSRSSPLPRCFGVPPLAE